MATKAEIRDMNLSNWVNWFDASDPNIPEQTTYIVPLQRGEQYTYVVKYDSATFGLIPAANIGMQICVNGTRIINGLIGSPIVIPVDGTDYITMTFDIQPIVTDGLYNLCLFDFGGLQSIFLSGCVEIKGAQSNTNWIRYRCSSNSCFNIPYGDIVAQRASYFESFRVNAQLIDPDMKDDTEVDMLSDGSTRVRYSRIHDVATWRLGYVDERIFKTLFKATRFDTFEIWDDEFQEWVPWTRDEAEAFAPEHPDTYPKNTQFTARTKLLRDDVDLVNTF